MSETNTTLEATVKRLNRIAAANNSDGDLIYNLGIEVRRRGLVYHFSCLESADHHEFVSGAGATPDAAAAAAATQISAACTAWEFEEVD